MNKADGNNLLGNSEPIHHDEQFELVAPMHQNVQIELVEPIHHDEQIELVAPMHQNVQIELVPARRNNDNTGRCFRAVIKVFFTLFLFAVVLLGGVTAKSTLLVLANAYTQNYSGSGCPMRFDPAWDGKGYSFYAKCTMMLILMTCLVFPELLTLLYSLKKYNTQTEKLCKNNWKIYAWAIIVEMVSAFGSTILVLKVVPNVDASSASAMFPLVAIVPAAMQAANMLTKGIDSKCVRFLGVLLVALIVISLLSIMWFLNDVGFAMWTISALLFLSLRHWENFVNNCEEVNRWQKELKKTRFMNAIIYSPVRMGIIVAGCIINYRFIEKYSFITDVNDGADVWFGHERVSEECSRIMNTFWLTGLTHSFAALGTFYFGRVACQACVQIFGFAIPLYLVTPLMYTLTKLYEKLGATNGISLMDFFLGENYTDPRYDFVGWKTNCDYNASIRLAFEMVYLVCGCFATFIFTCYLLRGTKGVLTRTKNLFVKPIYTGPLIVMDLILNRRRSDETNVLSELNTFRKWVCKCCCAGDSSPQGGSPGESSKSFVYVCATMWRETEKEVKCLYDSIVRLVENSNRSQQDGVDFEIHIVFDEAFDNFGETNGYVQRLKDIIGNCTKDTPMPYGQQWELDVGAQGETKKLYVHLKDIKKIRQGKRWSQCMYMRYILNTTNHRNSSEESRQNYPAENTFILAVDGDVDFQPKALTHLLDRMKREENVGAACGRIHPKGSGPVVWFQKFEYAVGHWLQKTTEHVLGCVLCTPGCFSLIRVSALSKVLDAYSSEVNTPMEKLLCDQGEDRWLCTLLLKQGSKIEYASTSECNTFAPDTFEEFYKQRRRWVPSTIANLLEVINHSKLITEKNSSVSWLYVTYQVFFFVASLLGPSTVVLLTIQAYQYVFGWGAWVSFVVALLPVIVFIAVCLLTKFSIQIRVAQVLTFFYAIVMMAVLAGLMGGFLKQPFSPGTMFFSGLAVIYIIAGLMHPSEWICLLCGIIYYVSVPSTFILLMIHSVCNLNDVSWGTRENAKKDQVPETKQNNRMPFWSMPCCTCIICSGGESQSYNRPPAHVERSTQTLGGEHASLAAHVERSTQTYYSISRSTQTLGGEHASLADQQRDSDPPAAGEQQARKSHVERSTQTYYSICRSTQTLGGEHASLADQQRDSDPPAAGEQQARKDKTWADIATKLSPGKHSTELKKKKEKQISEGLKQLRNDAVVYYLLINSMWLVLTEILAAKGEEFQITYIMFGKEVKVEPLEFLFLVLYIVLLVIQFLAMFVHRWSSFLHVMAREELCSRPRE